MLFIGNKYINGIRRVLLKLALGTRTYNYMVRSISCDNKIKKVKEVDLITRSINGSERRIEADWIKTISKLVF